MVPSPSYQDIIERISNYTEESKAIGILFVRPQNNTSQYDFFKEFQYYHCRSSKFIDFFLPGVSYFSNAQIGDEQQIGKIEGIPCYYSDRLFCNLLNEFENRSSWEYSGESELLIINALGRRLDFSNCLQIRFEKAIRFKAIDSIQTFMENLINLSKKEINTSDIQKNIIGKSLAFSAIETFLDKLPYNIGNTIQKSEIFMKRDLS